MSVGETGRLSFYTFAIFLLLVICACAPIWYVGQFYGNDGISHLRSASLILDFVRGGPRAPGFYELSATLVPNSMAHWLMSVLLTVVSGSTAYKMVTSLLYCLFVAAVGWLRFTTFGVKGLGLIIIFAADLALNRLWLIGTHNFILGTIIVLFTLGLVQRCENRLHARSTMLLAFCFAAAYFSHLMSFLMLVLVVGISIILGAGAGRLRSLVYAFAACLPVAPFALAYQILRSKEGSLYPLWYILNEPLSFSSVLSYLRGTDPFFIISRRYIPFTDVDSVYNSLAAPILWFLLCLILLSAAAFVSGGLRDVIRRRFPSVVIVLTLLILTLIAPDELGPTEGGIIRFRFFLAAMACLVTVIVVPDQKWVRRVAGSILAAVFAFQTLGLWEYALRYDAEFTEFAPAVDVVNDGDRIASIIVIEDRQLRFSPSPVERISSLIGVKKDVVIWDGYEMGFYFFPIIAASEDDRRLIREYSFVNVLKPFYPEANFAQELSKLTEQIEAVYQRTDVLLVRGRDARVDAVINRHFGPDPFYESANYRLFRRRLD